jgi:hypothetical protein
MAANALTAEQAHALIAQLQEQNNMLQQQAAAAPAAAAALAAQTAAAALAQAAVPRAPSRTKIPAASNYAGSAHTLDNWLREMQQQFEWYCYNTDAERVAMAAAQLRGSALDWWSTLAMDSKQSLRASFAEFELALRKRFQPVDSAKSARLALDSLAQGAKQSVHDYTTQFRRLLTAVPSMSADDRVHRYVQGLRPAVRSLLLLQDVRTLDDAIASAARIGSLSQYASHAAASSAPSSSSPMDLSVMQDLFALTGVGAADDDVASDDRDAASSDSSPVTRAELRHMHQQLLNAMQSQRRGPAGHSFGRGGRGPGRGAPRVSGLSEQQVRERLDAGTCFACGKPGHRKADCPTAGRADGKHQSGN